MSNDNNAGKIVKGLASYEIMNPVGSGQFGQVYKAKNLDNNEFVALKSISIHSFDNSARIIEMTDTEVEILSKIKNANVVNFIECIKTDTHIYTIYELCTGGTLEEILDKRKHLHEKEALRIFAQLLNGFRPLVEMNIMHRDIKPTNILFHEHVAKIGDFGFCKPLTCAQDVTQTMVGSPIYMAPEILKGTLYSMKADIYSMGVMLYEMLFGRAPFEDANIPGLLQKITKGNIIFPLFNPLSSSTERLIKRMLESTETQRIGWEELFSSFSSLNMASTPNQKVVKDPSGAPIFYNFDQSEVNGRDSELILSFFTKDCKQTRDKILFLWRTFSLGYDNITNDESHVVNFLMLRKIKKYSKEVDKILQNSRGAMTKKEFDMLTSQFDYTRMSAILKGEVSKFDEASSIYKTYVQTTVDPTKSTRVDNDAAFTAKDFDAKYFFNRVFEYAKIIKDRPTTESRSTNQYLYLNLLLDSLMLDDVYANFFELNVPFNEQSYMQNLFDMDEKELLELADEKFNYLNSLNA